jgi:hypothetical protein
MLSRKACLHIIFTSEFENALLTFTACTKNVNEKVLSSSYLTFPLKGLITELGDFAFPLMSF